MNEIQLTQCLIQTSKLYGEITSMEITPMSRSEHRRLQATALQQSTMLHYSLVSPQVATHRHQFKSKCYGPKWKQLKYL